MGRLDSGYAIKTPNLRILTDTSSYVTSEDLSNPMHPINNTSESGKVAGASVMIGSHIWIASGPKPSDAWFRYSKHVESSEGIYRQINNSLSNTSVGDDAWSDASMSNLAAVETFFVGKWAVTPNTGILTYTGEEECIYRFTISGDVRSSHNGSFGDEVGVQFYRDLTSDGLTSMTKSQPVSKSTGGVGIVVDFTLIGFARVQPDEVFRIQIASNFAATDLKIDNVIFELHPLDTLLYQ